MSIASEITRLQTAKADIKTAIEAKGVTVPSSAKLDDYDTYVSQISGGGGGTNYGPLVDRSITSISASELGNITLIGDYAFRECTSLESITIPNSVTKIWQYAFTNCSSLTNITIPDTVIILGPNVFSSCSGLITATIGTGVTNIQQNLFNGCTSLTTITINGNITRLYGTCFRNCSSLTTLSSLPTTLTTIDADVFSGCSLLTELNYQGTIAQWNAITKNSNWKRNSALTTIHCSDGDITL